MPDPFRRTREARLFRLRSITLASAGLLALSGFSGCTGSPRTGEAWMPDDRGGGASAPGGAPNGGPADGASGAARAGVGEGEERRGRGMLSRTSEFRPVEEFTLRSAFSGPDLPDPNVMRTGSGAPGPAYWQQEVDYRIEATLDPEARRLEGVVTMKYENHSPDELRFIWIHLEQNLFNPGSKGSRVVEPGTRFANRGAFAGGYDILSVRVDGQPVEMHVYDTLGRVDLPRPLRPRMQGLDTVEIEIAYAFNVPTFGADRMGIDDDIKDGIIFQFAQWFPAAAVYDDVHGWNTLPYLGQGEFYTNFGRYEVALTVPREFVVAATGVLQNPGEVLTPTQLERFESSRGSTETIAIITGDEVGTPESRPSGEGPLTWRYLAENVRTFAWTTSDAFIWDACSLDGSPGSTHVQSVYPREALPLWENSTQWLASVIRDSSERWFAYPYPVAINANGRCGGMEYPMILFCRARDNDRALFGVTAHEIHHNWFPMVVNTDERRHAWMDEGFATFLDIYANEEQWNEENVAKFAAGLVDQMRNPEQPPIALPPDQLPRNTVGWLQYRKTAAGLALLREHVLGHERFDAAFREYIRRWAFKSPRPADFFRTMEDVSGEDLGWFWGGWFYSTRTLDQSVESAAYDEGNDQNTVTFVNEGGLIMPVLYEVEYKDGRTERRTLPAEAWFYRDRVSTAWSGAASKVVRVTIDPDKVMPETSRGNNEWGR